MDATTLITVLLLGLAFSGDVLAVADELNIERARERLAAALSLAAAYAVSHALFAALGYIVVSVFGDAAGRFDHWAALALLAFVGVSMAAAALRALRVAQKEDEEAPPANEFDLKTALRTCARGALECVAAGVALAALDAPVYLSTALLGCTGFAAALPAFLVRRRPVFVNSACGFVAGCVLVAIGAEILLRHLFLGG